MSGDNRGLENKVVSTAVGTAGTVVSTLGSVLLKKAAEGVKLDGAYQEFVDKLAKHVDEAKLTSDSLDVSRFIQRASMATAVMGALTGKVFDIPKVKQFFKDESAKRLALTTQNDDQKSALQHLNAMLCFIEAAMLAQFDGKYVVAANYHAVLLSLHASVQSLFDEASDKGKLNEDRIDQLSKLSELIKSEFQTFANATAKDAGGAHGRLEVAKLLNENLEGFKNGLTRYKSKKPLEDTILQVGVAAHQASVACSKLLLSLVVVDEDVANKFENADVVHARQIEMSRIMSDREGMFSGIEKHLREKDHKSEAANREERSMFTRPFAKRMETLLEDEKSYRANLLINQSIEKQEKVLQEHKSAFENHELASTTLKEVLDEIAKAQKADADTQTLKNLRAQKSAALAAMEQFKAGHEAYQIASASLEKMKAQQANSPKSSSGYKKTLVFLISWFDMLKKLGTTNSQEIPADLERFKKEYEQSAGDFKLLNASLNKEKNHTVTTHDEAKFLQGIMKSMLQFDQLTAFTSALHHFMQMVGKLGMHNAKELHKSLESLLEKAQSEIQAQLNDIMGMVPKSMQHSSWLSEINKELLNIRNAGQASLNQMGKMKNLFADLQDKNKIEEQFKETKNRLLFAAQGLGLSVNLDQEKLANLTSTIDKTNVHVFISKMDPETIEQQERIAQSLAQVELETARATTEAAMEQTKKLQVDVEKLKAEATIAEEGRAKCDVAVNTYLTEFEKKSETLCTNAARQVAEAHKLALSASAAVGSEQKGQNAEEQDQKTPAMILEEATALKIGLQQQLVLLKEQAADAVEFQKNYFGLSKELKVSLERINTLAVAIEDSLKNLETTIVALKNTIASLEKTLAQKEKENADLRAELDALKLQLLQKGQPLPEVVPSQAISPPARNQMETYGADLNQEFIQLVLIHQQQIAFEKNKSRFKHNYIACLEQHIGKMSDDQKIAFANYLVNIEVHPLKNERGMFRKGHSNLTKSMAVIQGKLAHNVSEGRRNELLYDKDPANLTRHKSIYQQHLNGTVKASFQLRR